jgi:hypothetical protein
MAMNYPPSQSPVLATMNSDNSTQQQLMQAMLATLPAEQQAPIAAAMALQARKLANKRYLRDTQRKVSPALTNGQPTQPYTLNTPITFNMSTALNGYMEGLIVRIVLNYQIAGTGAFAPTAAGKLGIIDTVEVRYNKSQVKLRPQVLRQLALLGAIDEWMIPEGVLLGQQDQTLQSYLNPPFPLLVGANTTVLEFFIPLNLIAPDDERGLLPLMAGDTGVQVIINTPLALLGPDPIINSIFATGGAGNSVVVNAGSTVQVNAVYRDGDCYRSTAKLPFDISLIEGTFQMQIDQVLSPLIANTVQRTKLNIMGKHYYVILLVVDNLQSNLYATQNNIIYIESSKDGVGGNVFWKYGLQTNLSFNEFLFQQRFGGQQDVDPGAIPMITAPVDPEGEGLARARAGRAYLDNTRSGWADWRYGVEVAAVGAVSPTGPRIEPHVFYVNPVGLVPV